MATESPHPDTDAPMVDSATQNVDTPAPAEAMGRKRPRIEMDSSARKRGKSMFAVALGTLNKAKKEDRERNQSEAAKKRQEVEQRLQEKLRKETDSVRRAEEAKKDKTAANRKEEELQLKDSIYKLRRTRLPILSNFLCTSDQILDISSSPDDDSQTSPPKASVLAGPPRQHPPPLYYLPAILTPAQEAFLNKRKAEVKAATQAEWSAFVAERTAGVEEIGRLRQRVAEEEAQRKASKAQDLDKDMDIPIESVERPPAPEQAQSQDEDTAMSKSESMPAALTSGAAPVTNGSAAAAKPAKVEAEGVEANEEAKMDVDDCAVPPPAPEQAKREEKESAAVHVPMQADDDDAVEY